MDVDENGRITDALLKQWLESGTPRFVAAAREILEYRNLQRGESNVRADATGR